MSRRRSNRLTRWVLRFQTAGTSAQRKGSLPLEALVRSHFEALRPSALSTRCLSPPADVTLHAGRQDHSARHRHGSRALDALSPTVAASSMSGERSRPSSKFTLHSDDLNPEAVALALELDDAITKLPILDQSIRCVSGVDQSVHSLALTGTVGTYPLGVGRPLPRPPRSPLRAIHAATVTTQRHGSLPDSISMVTDNVTDDHPTAEERLFHRHPISTQGRTRSASSASSLKRTISSRLSRSASRISIVVALPSLTQIAFGGGPCRNAS